MTSLLLYLVQGWRPSARFRFWFRLASPLFKGQGQGQGCWLVLCCCPGRSCVAPSSLSSSRSFFSSLFFFSFSLFYLLSVSSLWLKRFLLPSRDPDVLRGAFLRVDRTMGFSTQTPVFSLSLSFSLLSLSLSLFQDEKELVFLKNSLFFFVFCFLFLWEKMI